MFLHAIISFTWLTTISAKYTSDHVSLHRCAAGIKVRGGNVSPSVGKKKKKRKASGAVNHSTSTIPLSDPVIPSESAMETTLLPINDTMTSSAVSVPVKKEKAPEHMPSLFTSPNESIYDKYAACVAATEGLRRGQEGMKKFNDDTTSVYRIHLPWRPFHRNHEKPMDSEEEKRKYAQYILQSSKIIKSIGLTVSQFNQISREVSKDISLKERVMEQAYLYRLNAAIHMDKVPIIEDPESEKLLKSHRRQRVQMFARSMTEIEELRTEQIERLRKALNIDHLPSGFNICDPTILPLLNPKVRAVCEAFPLQAEEIVQKYGLNSNEFNQMLEETRGNPVFRWRVKKYIGKATDSETLPIPLEITDDSEE